jgi:hypothetical protein
MNILPADEEFINSRWADISALLNLVTPHMFGEFTVKDILDFLLDERMQLFAATCGSEIKAVAVTEVVRYPQFDCMRVVCIAGTDSEEWDDAIDAAINAWARVTECRIVRASCRKGAARRLKKYGFTESYVEMTKIVDKE